MGAKLLSFIFAGLLALSNADLSHTMYADTSVTVNDVWTSEEQGEAVFAAVFHMPYGKSTNGMTGFYVRYSTRNGGNTIGDGQTVGDAQRDHDYVGKVGRIDWALSEIYSGSTKYFTVAIKNDNIVETTETFNVDLFHDNGVVWHDMNLNNGKPVKVTIDDDERALIRVSEAQATEGENGRFTFNVVLSHLTSTQTCLRYQTVSNQGGGRGRASSVQDFEYTEGFVKLNAQTKVNDHLKFYVPIINDNVQEQVETFEVLLSLEANNEGCVNSHKYMLEGNGRVSGTFLREIEGVQVTIDDQEREEGDGEFVFTVRMSHMVDTDVDVFVKTRDGDKILDVEQLGNPAVGLKHYLPVPQRRITFPRTPMSVQLGTGGNAELEESFIVQIINDNIQSPNNGNTDEYLWGRREFYVDYHVGHATSIASAGSADNVWDVATSSIKGKAGLAHGFLYDDEGATISIEDAPQRDESENEWIFNVKLSHGVSGWRSASGADFLYHIGEDATAQIGDANHPKWHDDIFAPRDVAPCGKGEGNNAFDMDHPNRRWIPISPYGGSTQTLVFANAEQGGDWLLEPTETFAVVIERGPNSAKYGIEVDGERGIGTIIDDDVGDWTLEHRYPPLFEEGVDTQVLFTVTLSHFPGDPVTLSVDTRDLGQTYTASVGTTADDVEDTPTDTQDYMHLGGYTLTFKDEDSPNRSKQQIVSVTLLNDNVQEPTEQFRVTFDAPQPGNLKWAASARNSRWVFPTIQDDECVTVSIDAPQQPEYEEDVIFPDGFHFTATLSHEISTPLSVEWQTVDHKSRFHRATEGIDYEYQTGTLHFDQNHLSESFMVSGLDDWEQEGASPDDTDIFAAYLETFSVEVIITTAKPPLLCEKASNPTDFATFWDNEHATIQISDAEGAEGDLSGLIFEVELSHKHPLNTVRAHYTTADCQECESKAGAGGNTDRGSNDYVPHNGYVDIAPTSTRSQITVSTKNDNVQEDTEGFQIIISSVDGMSERSSTDANWQATGWITDDEQMRLTINDSSATETEGSMVFTVTSTHKADQAVAYGINVVGGTAKSNVDFDGSDPQELKAIMHPFSTKTTFTVDLINDHVQENIEEFTVGIKSSSMVREYGDLLFNKQVATGSIIDFEDATISVHDLSDHESNTDFAFTVTLSHEVVTDVEVEWNAASAQSATPQSGSLLGGDFYEQYGMISFIAQDALTATIPVKVVDDFVSESPKDETFRVHLQNINLPTGTDFTMRFATTAKTATGTIKDDDMVTICIADAVATNEEDHLVFKVKMSHSVDTDVSVFFTTYELDLDEFPNAAIDPTHYSTTTKTLSFPRNYGLGAEGGPPAVNVVVPLVNNDVVNPTRILGASIDSLKPSTWNIVLANCDRLDEPLESAPATGFIKDSEGQQFSSGDNFCPEGEMCDFTISSSHAFESDLTVEWTTSDRTALSDPPAGIDQDYVSASGTLTFLAGEKTSQPFQVEILGDETLETSEYFDINFVVDKSVFDVIDPAPVDGIIPGAESPKITLKSPNECLESSGECVFEICVPERVSSDIVVGWDHAEHPLQKHSHDKHGDEMNDWPAGDHGFVTFTPDDEATIGSDGVARVFKTFTTTIIDDEVHERHEWFRVNIVSVSNPTDDMSLYPFEGGSVIFDYSEASAVAVIVNDDFATLVVEDGMADEGTQMTFDVTLSHQVYADVIVHYQTIGDTASACSKTVNTNVEDDECDFTAVTDGALQFVMPDWFAGSANTPEEYPKTQQIRISLLNDNIQEDIEEFTLRIIDRLPALSPNGEDPQLYQTWACDQCEHDDGTTGTGPWVEFHVKNGDDIVSCGLPFGAGDECSVTGFINDNEGANIVVENVSARETDGSLTFQIHLSHATDKQFTVAWTTTGLTGEELEAVEERDGNMWHSATAGSDFVSETGTFSFAAGQKGASTSRTLVVNLLNDDTLEGNEVFKLALSDWSNYGANMGVEGGLGQLIDDDEQATITLVDEMFEEADGSFNVRVQLSHSPDAGIVYAWATNGGTSTATEGSDYTAASGEVVFPANPANKALLTQTIALQVLNDDIQENTEFIAIDMTLTKPVPYGYVLPAEHTIDAPVYDQEGAEITIHDASTNEGSDMVFEVTFTHPVDADVSFEFQTVEGTAHAWTDPTKDLRGHIDFRPNGLGGNLFRMAAGERSGDLVIITSNDSIQEGTETFSIEVVEHSGSLYTVEGASDPSGYNLAFITTSATGAIIDKEGCYIISDAQSVNEVEPTMTFSLRMSHVLDRDIIVDYQSASGTATDDADGATVNEDFKLKTGSLTFKALDTKFTVHKVTIEVIDDHVQERDENVHLAFTAYRPVNQDRDYFIDIDTPAVGRLINDIENPTLELMHGSGSEGNAFSFGIKLSHAISHDTLVSFTTGDCNLALDDAGQPIGKCAESAFDYVMADNAVARVTAGSLVGDAFVTLINDNIVEFEDEWLHATITNVAVDGFGSYPHFIRTTVNQASGAIAGSKEGATLSVSDASGSEGETIVFAVTLSHGTDEDLPVTWVLEGVENPDGSMDTTTMSGEIIFKAGISGSQIDIPIILADDKVVEATETFHLRVMISDAVAPASLNLVNGGRGTGTIIDDDTAVISVGEGHGDESEGVKFPIQYADGGWVEDDVVIQWRVEFINEPGAATAKDFAIGDAVTNLQAVSLSDGNSFLVIPLSNDNIQGRTSKKFNLHIESMTLTNIDNSGGRVVLASIDVMGFAEDFEGTKVFMNAVEVDETAGDVVFDVLLSHQTVAPVSFTIGLNEGTAKEGSDFTWTSRPTGFFASMDQTPVKLNVKMLNDDVQERPETFGFVFTITQPTDGGVNNGQGVITITDNEEAQVTISDVTWSEDLAPALRFTVELSHALSEPINVGWTAVNIDTQPEDLRGPITTEGVIAMLQAKATYTFDVGHVVNDFLQELDEHVDATITGATWTNDGTPANNILATGTGHGTIASGEVGATVEITDAEAREGSTLRFAVTLSHQPADRLVLRYSTISGSADGTKDFFGTNSGEMAFEAGELDTVILVKSNPDSWFEGDETFTISLTNLSPFPEVETTAVGTIKEDEGAIFTVSDANISEGDTVTFTASLNKQVDVPMTVTYDVEASLGGSMADFSGLGGSHTIPAKASVPHTWTFTASALRDNLVERSAEICNVRVVTPTGFKSSEGQVVIADGDVGTLTVSLEETIEEGNGEVEFLIDMSLDSNVDTAFFVNVNTLPSGSSLDGLPDFVPVNKNVQFQGFPNERRTVSVQIIGDTLVEMDEQLTTLVSFVDMAAYNGLRVNSGGVFTTRVTNDDIAFLHAVPAFGTESSGEVVFVVELSQPVDSDVSFSYFVTDGENEPSEIVGDRSKEGVMFGTMTILAGTTSTSMSVEIGDDDITEGPETFEVLFHGINSNRRGVVWDLESRDLVRDDGTGGAGRAIGTIVDDDIATMSVAVTSGGLEVDNVAFTVSMDRPLQRPITFSYALVPGTAVGAGGENVFADYRTVGETSSTYFNTPVNFAVQIVDDNMCEDTETFSVQLTNTPEWIRVGPPAVATIVDDDSCQFSIVGQTCSEMTPRGVSSCIVDISLSGGVGASGGRTQNFASIDVRKSDITTDAADFANGFFVNDVFTTQFGPADLTVKAVSIMMHNDELAEGTEQFRLSLENPRFNGRTSPAITTSAASVVISVNDDPADVAVFSFDVLTQEADEGMSLTYTLNLSHKPQRGFSFNVNAGLDSDDVIFANPYNVPAMASQTSFTFQVADDGTIEGTQTISLNVVPNSNVARSPNTPGQVVVRDNDTYNILEKCKTVRKARGQATSVDVSGCFIGDRFSNNLITVSDTPGISISNGIVSISANVGEISFVVSVPSAGVSFAVQIQELFDTWQTGAYRTGTQGASFIALGEICPIVGSCCNIKNGGGGLLSCEPDPRGVRVSFQAEGAGTETICVGQDGTCIEVITAADPYITRITDQATLAGSDITLQVQTSGEGLLEFQDFDRTGPVQSPVITRLGTNLYQVTLRTEAGRAGTETIALTVTNNGKRYDSTWFTVTVFGVCGR